MTSLLPSLIAAFQLLAAAPLDDYIADPDRLSALPAPQTPYAKYLRARRLKCLGDGAAAGPEKMEIGGRRFVFDGLSLALEGADRDGLVTVGVLGAVKDFSPETREALTTYMRRFEAEGADALLLLGDLAATEMEITRILLHCARRPWPVLALIGNSESRAAFNRAVLAAVRAAPNVVNFDLVRRVDLGGAVLVSLPGYTDKSFVHQSSGCVYRPRDVRELERFVGEAPGRERIVLVSHGPPAGKGPRAIDRAVEAGNVGDPELAGFIREHGLRFGLFSHILEAGGRAVDAGQKPVGEGGWHETLFINAGSANPLAWQLNDGSTSCGMAVLLRVNVKTGRASHRWIRLPCRK
ncbi:MAG: hypothetical protein JXR96_06520 [Deltaproteobacteria bacterium]|nr:hypothetical protein [Deltaproteobacteria bacterium]